jgi:adenylate kinase family enzyme
MSRIAIIGNAGGGKSTLARKLAKQRGLRHIEIDRLLWQGPDTNRHLPAAAG